MSGFKDVVKGGWHPKGKDGGKESWRGDFKGVNTVAGWVGKGKDSSSSEAPSHQSAPLSTLKDPASFGAPPKHVNYHGPAAAAATLSTPNNRGLGIPPSASETSANPSRQDVREAESHKEAEIARPPPAPYRADTTGLNTSHLPKPPVRRGDQTSLPPSNGNFAKSAPKLPPRLPPRQNSHPDFHTPEPPPSYDESTQSTESHGTLNHGALNRLGQAGVSVPGLNIGRNSSPPVPPRQSTPQSNDPESSTSGDHTAPLNELQSRFSKLSSSSSGTRDAGSGTSFADKQSALNTANSLRTDPSKVSVADVRSAATTANNFRERHGEQVATGWKTANNLNQKYGVTDRASSLASAAPTSPTAQQSPTQGVIGKKKPPPPPKKKDLPSHQEPPPIPLGSKPKF